MEKKCLTLADGQVSIVCHRRLYTVYCVSFWFRGATQPLPSHSCTNSRRQKKKTESVAYPSRISLSSSSHFSLSQKKMFHHPADAQENLALSPGAELRRRASQHILCIVSPLSLSFQVKITSWLYIHVCVGVGGVCGLFYRFPRRVFKRECCKMARRFLFFFCFSSPISPLRWCGVSIGGKNICPCNLASLPPCSENAHRQKNLQSFNRSRRGKKRKVKTCLLLNRTQKLRFTREDVEEMRPLSLPPYSHIPKK